VATYYAWSNFKKTINEQGQVTEWIRPGDTITQSDLKCSDRDWTDLIEVGAVRTKEYPPIPSNVPPVEYYNVDDEKKVLLEEAAEAEASGSAPGLTAPPQAIENTQKPQAATPAPATTTEAK
jgi:hypothetical protein